MERRIDITVLGMGIGGLSFAVAVARLGHKVTIVDRMQTPGPVGSGFVLQPTGLEVLRRLGLGEAVDARGAVIRRMLGIVRPSDRVVLDIGYPDGGHGLAIQRGALFDILVSAARQAGVAFRFGINVTGVELDGPPRPTALSMERMPACDLVVDAMGGRSPTCDERESMRYGALWATVPWDEACPFAEDVLEQRYHQASSMAGVLPVGTMRDGAARMATVFWSVRNGRGHDDWQREAAELWPEMRPLLARAMPVHAVYRHHTRRPVVRPGVIRIGDAWHSTSPQLGQGANMALIDALSLACAIEETDSIAQAFRLHVGRRRLHVSTYQAMSRLLTPFYQSDGDALPLLRDHVTAPLIGRKGPVRRIVSKLVTGGMFNPLGRIPELQHVETGREAAAA